MLKLANFGKCHTVKLALYLCTMAPGINMKPWPSALCWKYLSVVDFTILMLEEFWD